MAPRAQDSGVRPQLLNSISEDKLEKYIIDNNFCAQEKYDGVRKMIIKENSKIIGVNKKGLVVDVIQGIQDELNKLDINYIVDGEAFENYIILFDCLIPRSYKERYKNLSTLIPNSKYIKIAPTAFTTKEKRALLACLMSENAEGIVFKNIHSKYTPGRPNSGGDMLKYKFTETCTCQVLSINKTKRSIALAMYTEEGKIVNVGNVTVYPNQDIPLEGSFVEVQYLYFFLGGSLFQPVLKGPRIDCDTSDCNIAQLKIKRELTDGQI